MESGNALFREGSVSYLNEIRDAEGGFGIVPPPKFDEAQDSYYVMMSNCSMSVTLPVTSPDVERSALIIEALGAYSYETLHHAYYEIVLKDKLTRDPYSAQMLDIIIGSKTVDLGVINEVAWDTVITSFLSTMRSNGASRLSSLAAKNQKKFNITLEKIRTKYQALP